LKNLLRLLILMAFLPILAELSKLQQQKEK
jgi:hypothetical protein